MPGGPGGTSMTLPTRAGRILCLARELTGPRRRGTRAGGAGETRRRRLDPSAEIIAWPQALSGAHATSPAPLLCPWGQLPKKRAPKPPERSQRTGARPQSPMNTTKPSLPDSPARVKRPQPGADRPRPRNRRLTRPGSLGSSTTKPGRAPEPSKYTRFTVHRNHPASVGRQFLNRP